MSFHPLASRLRILEHLRRLEPVSRTQLCQSTGLANATVSDVVRDLLSNGFLLEQREAASGRGRPPILLKTDPHRLVIAGAFLHVANNRLETSLTNLLGETLAARDVFLPAGFGNEALVEAIVGSIAALRDQVEGEISAPAALAICLPGIVDAGQGVLHWLPPSPPATFPIGDILTERTGLPVFVDNVCNVLARGERWFGETGFQDDLCVVFIGPGIGLGQYVGGSLHRGAHGLNAEFGHVKTGIGQGEICGCGGRGCLTQSAGMVALAQKANTIFGQNFDALCHYVEAFDYIAEQAEAGREQARLLLARAADALGIALANHVMMWDPSRIVIISASAKLEQAIGEAVVASVARHLPDAGLYAMQIDFRQESAQATVKSSTALGLDGMIYRADLADWRVPS
jgi:predicted NBD/HSP70 family sugar kinase